MGQYYYPIILSKNGKIVAWMNAHQYGNGLKLTEHSFVGNNFVCTVEFELTPLGAYHKRRVVWAGDYADEEVCGENLYHLCSEHDMIAPHMKGLLEEYRYVVNHSKKQFVDKKKVPSRDGYALHPLPLLTCEGNGRGGGDYHDAPPIVGSWARDVISVETEAPSDFEEIVFDLVEKI